ncbi:MAG: dicarboxylate/amino acid:cation symporter [Bacteroidales bacterium]
MKKIQLHWQILIALVLSVLFGYFFTDQVRYVEWMGDLFLRALQMIIAPLIFASIVTGVLGLGSAENLGRMSAKTFGYYVATSLIAAVIGLFVVNVFKPGVGADLGLTEEGEILDAGASTFADTLMEIIPTNIFQALAETDMLSIIFFAILFGFFATRVGPKYKEPIEKGFNAIFEVMMRITMFIIRFAPLGVFGIVSGIVAEQAHDLIGIFSRMGVYVLSVALALAIHSAIVLPLIMKYIGKVNPLKHFRAMSVPLLTAFTTSSSSATLPLAMDAVENKSGVSKKVTGFVLPLGATVNMNGTALYDCVSVLFIAQAYGIELTLIQQTIVVLTALLASVGAAGIPMAGLVVITIILSVLGMPLEGVGLILAVERILDMFRTSVNVWSDTCGAAIIAKSEGEMLKV